MRRILRRLARKVPFSPCFRGCIESLPLRFGLTSVYPLRGQDWDTRAATVGSGQQHPVSGRALGRSLTVAALKMPHL